MVNYEDGTEISGLNINMVVEITVSYTYVDLTGLVARAEIWAMGYL